MKRIKILVSIFFIAYFSHSVKAQFPNDIPYQSIQTPSSIAFPNFGESVIDTSVSNPIQITRITEQANYIDGSGNPQIWYPTHDYSKTQIWNADQSLFKISSWKVFDANTYQVTQDLSGAIYPSYWSNTNPNLIWSFKENGVIKKYFVSNDSTHIVDTLETQAGSTYEYMKLGPGEGNIDNNDHYVALVGKDGLDMDVIVYDLQNSQIIFTRKFVGAWQNGGGSSPHYVDWVSVSQSGNYVVIMWNHNTSSQSNPYVENGNSHYGVEVYNPTDMLFQNRIMSYGNHGDLGYAVDGDEVLVQFYGWYGNGTLYMHKLDGSGSTNLTTNTDFGVAGHVSCRNINRPGWAYVTHSLAAESGQMVAVKLDNSGLVEHFGHHFSSATSYAQAAMAVSSPNGDKICFKSDFGAGPYTSPSVAYSFFAGIIMDSDSSFSITNCDSYTSPSGNYIWTTSGTFMDTIPNVAGFDSVMTINLTINNSSSSSISPIACYSYTSISGLNTWNTSGIYHDTISNYKGCDSLITINLTINNNTDFNISPSVCDIYVSLSGLYAWNTSGLYHDTISNFTGCDSIITINLTVNTVDVSVTNNATVLTANTVGDSYQWLNCDNENTDIVGETNQSFTATLNGNYSVEINNNGCIDTSECFSIVSLSIIDNNSTDILLVPNPNNGTFRIENLIKNSIIEIFTLDGKSVLNKKNYNNNTLNLKLEYLETGIYFMKIRNNNFVEKFHFVIE